MSGFLRRSLTGVRVISDQTLDEALAFHGQATHTGRPPASPERSLQVATVFRCVRVLADNIAQLPLKVYRTDSQGKREEARNHPLWALLHVRPNRIMTPFLWKQTVFSSVLLRGNTYNQIEFSGTGWPEALWPLQSASMNARLERRRPLYDYSPTPADRIRAGRIDAYRVHHLRSMANDGFLGRSVVRQAMHTLGLAMATEEFGARFFGQGAQPGVALMHPQTLSTQAKENIRESWDKRHAGPDGSHKTAVLEEGMTVERIGIPPEEAQFLGTRSFQTLEICRWFGVPPHMAYDLERATFSNIEHQSIAFVQDSLMPWIVNHEEQMQTDLVEREGYESNVWAEYAVDGRLRGDTLSRYRTHQIGIMYGLRSPNEARAKENDPPYDGGDQMFMTGNLVPIEKVSEKRNQGKDGEAQDVEPAGGRQARSERRNDQDVQALRDLWSGALDGLESRLADLVAWETSAVAESLEQRTLSMFLRWLQDFYDQVSGALVEALRKPLVRMAVRTARRAVLDLDETWTAELRSEMESYAEEVLAVMGDEYAASHRRQLEALIRDEGEEAGDAAARAAVEERLLGWTDTEAERRARKTAFEAGNAVAMAAMAAVGIVRVAWSARGDACKYCRALDGEIVEIGKDFVAAGGSVTAADGESLAVSRRRGHPPLHGGCDCGTRAVRED